VESVGENAGLIGPCTSFPTLTDRGGKNRPDYHVAHIATECEAEAKQ